MKLHSQIVICILMLVFGDMYSQELPPIESFAPRMYDADNQNWDLSQSEEKYIYVANNKGLLEYNGANWNLYSTPNQTVMRSVHVLNDRVYSGCYMEFGYWKRDTNGTLEYYSLSEKIDRLIEDEEFWKIVSVKQWILFQSLDRIYVYDTILDSFSIVEPESTIVKMYKIDDDVYFQDFENGVFKIVNGMAVQVISDPQINDSRIANIFKHENGLLLITARKGFYEFSHNKLSKWEVPANNFLVDKTIYSALQLIDGTFLLGSISNGLLAINPEGGFEYLINQSKGLQDNTVLSIFEDVDRNIWLGLDYGINFVNSFSPYRIYNDYSGKLGTVYASRIFQNNIYLGTNQGLFFKPIQSVVDYKLVLGTGGQVWNLNEINGQLFCGHDSGTFIIDDNQATLIANIQGTWGVKEIEDKPNIVLQGNYDGLNILEYKNETWVFRNKIEGFDISSRYFEFYNSNTIFISHEYKGVFKVVLNDSLTQVASVDKLPQFTKGLNSSLIKHNNNIVYANNSGVYNYNQIKNEFVKDSIWSKLYSSEDYISGKLIQDNFNKIWNFSKYNLSYLDSGSFNNSMDLSRIALPEKQVNSMNGYENITHLKDEEYLIGTSNGYMIVDLSKLNSHDYSISINTIEIGNLDLDLKKVKIDQFGNFENETNNINFAFSIPEYYRYSEKRYQYLLEGYNTGWSDWTVSTSHLFENLPHGNYTFRVKGRVGNIETTNTASFQFAIKKPWYLSNLFIAIYILGGLLLLITVHLIYRSYYKNQRQKLLQQTQKDLDLKELENKQQISKFKNESLTQDIENKNRELAISTMSLIKKNEFLNGIKEELKKLNGDKGLNSVIKLIDKNINNTNDWELFEEAFNNADKDFLKKVKSKHPSLTSNDLRLCAYLRLNLSSKEIAPLLNISVRSVEVKRYRLRKKMNLEHEMGLTDYILDL